MRLPDCAIDDEILAIVCQDETTLHRISVDDFADPEETDVSSDQIHVTLIRMEPAESPLPFCLKLSTTSAQELVRQLTEAIAKRGGDVG